MIHDLILGLHQESNSVLWIFYTLDIIVALDHTIGIVRVVGSLKASIKVILISLMPYKPATEDKQNISEKNYQYIKLIYRSSDDS